MSRALAHTANTISVAGLIMARLHAYSWGLLARSLFGRLFVCFFGFLFVCLSVCLFALVVCLFALVPAASRFRARCVLRSARSNVGAEFGGEPTWSGLLGAGGWDRPVSVRACVCACACPCVCVFAGSGLSCACGARCGISL
jgi:hypothetical protein